MGHSADYQSELYIRELEQMAQAMADKGAKLKDEGHDALARTVLDKAERMQRAIAALRSQMDK
jgi:hypothetical protein